ncbi:protein FAR1-related sequence 5 [Tanacetum coccineum]
MAPKRRTTRLNPSATPTPVTDTHTTTSVTNAQIQAMINEGVTAALAARDATRNGDDSHTSGTGALIVNIWVAPRAHHLLNRYQGGLLACSHGSTVEFKNFFRCVNCYYRRRDAQMLYSYDENRKKHVSDFRLITSVDNADLTAYFLGRWKYKMVFVPFTAIDNHRKCVTVAAGLLKIYKMVFVPFTVINNQRKCVTVAAGLLKNETTKSYIWLLKAFIKAFGKAPSMIVTSQDGAMRNAIEVEFVGSKHRLCMWHITQKLPAKICAKIYDETDFKKKFNKIVWNMYIGPEEFEYKCGKLMEEFKLMRPTSRSESENSFFSHFTNSGSTLMNFMNCFETAMEKQRHVQERMDHKTIDIFPKLKTFLKIECYASNVYTRSLFKLNPYVYEMPKKKKKPQSVDKGKDKAEEDDIVDLFFRKDRLYKNVVVENFANEETSIVDHCVHLLSKDEPRVLGRGAFVEKLKSLKKEVEADCPNPPSKNKTDYLEQLVGVLKPPAVDVNNPTVGSTKGQKKLRIKGGKEKAIKKSLKGWNSCLCVAVPIITRGHARGGCRSDEVRLKRSVSKRKFVVIKAMFKRKLCSKKYVREVVQVKIDLAKDEEELVKEDEELIHE